MPCALSSLTQVPKPVRVGLHSVAALAAAAAAAANAPPESSDPDYVVDFTGGLAALATAASSKR